ncbi:endonuclease/exonuclease/phosphatase family protein [Sphingobacterium lactis]|uniref:Metal-dependent hydrolase, endonuclease/exonuclease/phosphatase family n=1 Tax=Sphingobacterium lactis TaxID=797291 RepID=A0A1H5Y2A8_9SPHI|nr:endonuclease/exonuclease/phosphatase family protein [Sphingobacterium lactis]SEG18189.1 Metal-dependent hydrolase, endonuclease/exonuclease/phosphatase family [Sphingobacterium lactis]
MKRIFYFLLITLAFIGIPLIVFYLWASSGTSEESAISGIKQLPNTAQRTEFPGDSTVSIMTYNIGYLSGMTNNLSVKANKEFHDANMAVMKDYLKGNQPDIIAFQEIDYGSKRSFETDQEQEIAQGIYPFAARAVNWNKNYLPFPHWPISVHFRKVISGQSVISKFPITEQQIDTLSRVQDEPFYYRDFYLNRLAQICTLKVGNQQIMVINVHLEAFDRDTRQIHSERVLKLFQDYSQKFPTIIVGDFNSDPNEDESTIRSFFDQGIASAAVQGDINLFTYPADKPDVRIDYIFYSPHFELLESKVVKEVGDISDHLPVYAKLKLKPF